MKLSLFAVLALATAPALAQYKVVAPDGSVTYTDRPPPAAANVSITPLGRSTAPTQGGGDPSLPLELRQAAARYPVTLYTAPDCPPCDSGRRLLQQRGIPYTEKRVASEEDAQALERLVGGRTVPSLSIGAQPLRGFNDVDWSSFLDAAGYPKESRLPRNWPVPVATPLTAAATATPAPAPPPPRPPAVPEPPPANAPRF